MEYVKLGNSPLIVSRFCVGCMGFGDPEQGMHKWTLGLDETKKIIKSALDSGLNFFDTAIAYQNGTSEQYVGKALNEYAQRDKVVVATKFLPRTQEEIENNISFKDHVNKMLDQSLKNLGMDYVDLYIYHMWDSHTELYDIMEALNGLVESGKVKALGISNCYAWQLAEANALAEHEGFAQFCSMQGHYNLIFREEEREMIPYCRMKNIALTPYSALAAGRLSKRPEEHSGRIESDAYAKGKYDETQEQDDIIRNRVAELADKYNCSMTEISLAWLLSKVTSPIVGVTKERHIQGMIGALELNLMPDDLLYLEEAYVPHKLVGVMAGK